MKHLRDFNDMASFNEAKPSLPDNSVSRIQDGDTTLVFFKHENGAEDMRTVGRCPFRVGQSIIGGLAIL